MEKAVARHQALGWKRYTPLDVDEKVLSALRKYHEETAQDLEKVLPYLVWEEA
ncbi:MAG: hypothetical protein ABDH20_01495 [Thermus sp.]